MDPHAASKGLILVVGTTGALGRPVVKLLRERGASVRAFNRHPEQAADLAALGAEVVAGDLTDTPSLQRACVGVQRVLAAAHGILGRGRWRGEAVDAAGHRALIDAARAAGVRRFVYTSALGARADHPIDFFRTAGMPSRASHLPAGLARVIGTFATPLHPGMARIMKLMSLPDDAFSERFEGATAPRARPWHQAHHGE